MASIILAPNGSLSMMTTWSITNLRRQTRDWKYPKSKTRISLHWRQFNQIKHKRCSESTSSKMLDWIPLIWFRQISTMLDLASECQLVNNHQFWTLISRIIIIIPIMMLYPWKVALITMLTYKIITAFNSKKSAKIQFKFLIRYSNQPWIKIGQNN